MVEQPIIQQELPKKPNKGLLISICILVLIVFLGLVYLLMSGQAGKQTTPGVYDKTTVSPTPESIEEEVDQVQIDDLDADFKDLEKDVNQL